MSHLFRNVEWRAYVRETPATMYEEVALVNGGVFVTGIGPDEPVLKAYAENQRAPESEVWLRLPVGALRAIAEAVKPGPDSKEVGRLEEALSVERRRVDNVLEKLA